jgi:hypothetical protein
MVARADVSAPAWRSQLACTHSVIASIADARVWSGGDLIAEPASPEPSGGRIFGPGSSHPHGHFGLAWSTADAHSGIADLTFVDIVPQMLGADGKPRKELLVEDGLHMTPAGYRIWNDALRPILQLSRSSQ